MALGLHHVTRPAAFRPSAVPQVSFFLRAVLHATVFILVFGWRASIFGDLTVVAATFALLLWLIFDFRAPNRFSINFIIAMLPIGIYSASITLLTGAGDIVVGLRFLRVIIITVGCLALVRTYIAVYKNFAILRLTADLFWAIGFHAVIMIGMYIAPEFRYLILAICNTAEYVSNPWSLELGLRVTGLTYGLATTSVLQLMGIFLAIALLSDAKLRFGVRTYLVVPAIIFIAFSTLLAGRSGLIIGSLLLPFSIFFMRKSLFSMAALIAIVAITVFLTFQIVDISTTASSSRLDLGDQLAFTVGHTREVDFSWTTVGLLFSIFSEMLVFPEGAITFLFGNGHYGRDLDRYVNSDVGFILGLHTFGLIGTILFVLPYFLALQMVRRSSVGRALQIAVLLILISVIFLHFKQVSMFTRQLWSVQALLVFLIIEMAPPALARAVMRPG